MTKLELLAISEALSDTPETIGQMVKDCAADSLTVRPPSGDFAVVEAICHLRDLEREGYSVRLQKLLIEPTPSLPDIDGGRLAIERDYLHQDAALALRDFAVARQETVRALRELTTEQLDLTGNQEGVGAVSVSRLVEMMREHDEGHLDELRRLCATLTGCTRQ